MRSVYLMVYIDNDIKESGKKFLLSRRQCIVGCNRTVVISLTDSEILNCLIQQGHFTLEYTLASDPDSCCYNAL